MAQEPHHDKTRSKAQNKRAGPERDEYRLRQRAYEIWVEEGRPDGRALDHWMLARQELEWTPDLDADLEQVAQEFEPGCETLETLAASLKDEGGFYFAPSRSAIEGSKGRKIESVAISEAAEGGSVLKLTGGDPSAPSSGFTGGFSIRLPDAFERQASEHTVRVRVLARSTGDASTRMAIAYSTAEVGNSGWQWCDVGAMWSIPELIWKVPKMINGNGDYIGLMPNEPGTPGVEIYSVSATVLL